MGARRGALLRGLWLEGRDLSFRRDLPEPGAAGAPGTSAGAPALPPAAPHPAPPAAGDAEEAIVRVTLAGICGTDLHMTRGYVPFTGIPGHEFVGVVERGPAPIVGRRVAGEINASCGRCPACRSGRGNHCPTRTVLGIAGRNGAFAERLALPAGNLHLVPDGLEDRAAVFTEPLAAALRILDQTPIAAGDRVLVVGDGRLGQLAARVLARTGCDLTVAGRHDAKLDLLASLGIATRRPEAVTDAAHDVVVEATGSAEGFAIARRAVRPAGRIVLKSTYPGALQFDASSLVVDEVALIGSRCGPFDRALPLLASGEIDPLPLIAAEYALDEGVAAFERASSKGVLKVLLVPNP